MVHCCLPIHLPETNRWYVGPWAAFLREEQSSVAVAVWGKWFCFWEPSRILANGGDLLEGAVLGFKKIHFRLRPFPRWKNDTVQKKAGDSWWGRISRISVEGVHMHVYMCICIVYINWFARFQHQEFLCGPQHPWCFSIDCPIFFGSRSESSGA